MAAERGLILESIASEMRTCVLALDHDGRVLYANPYFLDSFPVPGGPDGRHVAELIRDPDLLSTVEGMLGGGAPVAGGMEVSESGRSFKARIVPLSGSHGSGILIFLQDITEEKRVETIKRDFVANVSHELRTPLASIKGYSETLLDGGMDDRETLREFLRIIDRHATRMSRLIEDLLILSRIESQQSSLAVSPVDLKELIQATTTGFERQAGDKGIRVSSVLPEDLPMVAGDRDRLEQVLVNLLDNAIKYTPAGGSVGVSASGCEKGVVVDVRDTGIGIPEADMPRIFERFYRVDKARSRELGGTGLGLAIVKHIIQMHNGEIRVRSSPGRGSTFSFTLESCA